MTRGRNQRSRDAQARRNQDGWSDDFNGASNDNRGGKPQLKADWHFTPKSDKQQTQADLIDANDISFCIGPAGTGKTHVAMVKAIEAFQNGEVDTILLARPAVEAGTSIGFLPGDQNAKMEPYMRPLYDEMDAAYGRGNYTQLIRSVGNRNKEDDNPNGPIEVAPIGTMRGRTFKRAFVILDEAQNLKAEELKMALTRLGPGSKMVITGDPEQIDLEPATDSGLTMYLEKLKGVEGVGYMEYSKEDVMRHPTVQRIVDVLEQTEGTDASHGKDRAKPPVTGNRPL